MRTLYYLLTALCVVLLNTLHAQETSLSKGEAVTMVLENNFGVKIAQNNIDIAKNNKGILNSGYLPTLAGNAGANYARSNINTEFPGQFETDANGVTVPRADFILNQAESQRYTAGVNLDYTLFDGLGRYYDYKRLKEEHQLSELQARETIEITIVQLFSVYYEVARISENIRVLKDTYSNTEERLQRAEYGFEYGQNNKLDVLNAEVDLVTDSINLMTERQSLKNTIRDLNVVLNTDLEQHIKVDTTVTFISPLELDSYYENAETNNISMLQANSNITINDYTLKSAKSVFLPTIGLTGSYGWNLNQTANSTFFPGVNTSTRTLGLGANLTWNLFDGGSGITAVKNAKILLDSQDKAKQQLLQEVRRDIGNARGTYANLLAVYNLQEQNVITATVNFERSNEQYKIGQITSVALRQAQLNLLNAETNKNQAKYTAKLAELQYLQLIGQLLNVNF